MIIHREVDDAATESEQGLPRISVSFVLLYGILRRLFRQAVLELEGRNWQAVDEEGEIEGSLCLVTAVMELARNAEPICGVSRHSIKVLRRGNSIKQIHVMFPVI